MSSKPAAANSFGSASRPGTSTPKARGRLARRDLLVEQRHPALEVARPRRVLEQQEVAPPVGRVGGRQDAQVAATVSDLAVEAGEDQVGAPAQRQAGVDRFGGH
ncbi:hypothetical protein [Scleromatobacter humisilvae]|uniref:Uncharacterized protein n=1 Tax=Scleromatobacter humisilvae TaxID=2897159 RepID=A0A9X1YG88_9BURK|nr:hypothetical protein [Scleromatobacter humisilvae]MCK9685152.1 hypothetical protein [Scleromatobacter humisilvae]